MGNNCTGSGYPNAAAEKAVGIKPKRDEKPIIEAKLDEKIKVDDLFKVVEVNKAVENTKVEEKTTIEETDTVDGNATADEKVLDDKNSAFPWLSDEYGAASLHSAEFPPLTNQEKLDRLKNVKLFVLDNSVRESTVAQNRGHTFADKFKILDNVKSCKGIHHQLIANFSSKPRVDDLFAKEFNSKPRPEYSGQNYYCFSELFDTVVNGIPSMTVPIGCQRAAEYGIKNIMFELDLMNPVINWEGIDMEYYLSIYRTRFDWVRANVNKDAFIFVNIRDFSFCWDNEPRRIARVIHYLSTLPSDVRIFGLAFEDPLADVLPMSVCEQARRTRAIMNAGGWTDAHFITHIHYGFGLAEATVLEFLMGGGDGLWGSISRVGAASGHANSLTTVYNLHRLGNKYVQETYSLPAMRNAAIEITRITTGKDPDSRTELYGSRALDKWFDTMGTTPRESVGASMEVVGKTRISILATPMMVQDSLVDFFGPRDGNPPLLRRNIHAKSPAKSGKNAEQQAYIKEWDLAICQKMLNVMHQDLKVNRKEEVDTAIGLCSLYERAGGIPDAAMLEVISADMELNNHKVLKELQEYYEAWANDGEGLEPDSLKQHYQSGCLSELGDQDHGLSHEQFYEAFLKDELTSFDSPQTKEVFDILDFDHNGVIDWHEIVYRVKWVLQEYPDECTSIKDTIHCLYENYLELEVEHHKRQQQAQKHINKWKTVAKLIVPSKPKSAVVEDEAQAAVEELNKELPQLPLTSTPDASAALEAPSPAIVDELQQSTHGESTATTAPSVVDSSITETPRTLGRVKSIRFVPPAAIEIDAFGEGVVISNSSKVSPANKISPSHKGPRFVPPTALERQKTRRTSGLKTASRDSGSNHSLNQIKATASTDSFDLNTSQIWKDTSSSGMRKTSFSSNSASYYVTADGRRHAGLLYHVSGITEDPQHTDGAPVVKRSSPHASAADLLVISMIEEDVVYEDED